MQQKIALIINSSRKLSTSTLHCFELLNGQEHLHAQKFFTNEPQHAVQLAQEAIEAGFNYIVAVGGDGTCNEVVNGILLSDKSGSVSFGIIPNGTGNDFLKSFGAFEPEKFVSAITENTNQAIDIVQVKSDKRTIYALNIAGIGFDGYVVQILDSMRKSVRLKGKLAYVIAILRSFILYRKSDIRFKSDDFDYRGKMLLTAICNGKAFGHGLYIHPTAKLNDNQLGITLLGKVSFFEYVKNVGKLKRGEIIDHPEVHYLKTTELSIKTKGKTLFTQVDGELFDSGNMEFKVIPNALTIISK